MRLGVVLTGTGAHAAACAGLLRALEERGIEPYCVCGMGGGAWPAALWALRWSDSPKANLPERSYTKAAGPNSRRLIFCPQTMGKRSEKPSYVDKLPVNLLY